jgi:L-cysteine S-thiosulfotransferase
MNTVRKYSSIAMIAALLGSMAAWADPASDLKQMRDFFKSRFPNVATENYTNGLYALPGFEEYRDQWLAFRDLPPYEIGLANGKKLWETPFRNGKTFASCFKNGGKNIAQGYPYWDKATKKVRTVEMDLIDCANRHGSDLSFLLASLDRDQKARVQLAELSAYFYSMSRGKPLKPDVDFNDPDALAAYENGKKYWWARHGQWNFSCASCHVNMAGKNLGGNQPLSAAIGHGTAWPAQRVEWSRLETLHYRYISCLSQMRARPPNHGSDVLNHLELYEKTMSTGLPLQAPSMRN